MPDPQPQQQTTSTYQQTSSSGGIVHEENRFFKYIIPILCLAIFTLAGVIYHQDQDRQDAETEGLSSHEQVDADNYNKLYSEFTVLNSNVYQLCLKTSAPCQQFNTTSQVDSRPYANQ